METQVLISREDGTGQMAQIMAVLATVVEEFGRGHRYPTYGQAPYCRYVNAACDGPDCLVAQVMWRLGWTVEDLQAVEGHGRPRQGYGRFSELHTDVQHVLSCAQEHQDNDRTWGDALDRAIAYAQHLGYDVN